MKETQISIGVPTEKLIEGYLKSRETKYTVNESKIKGPRNVKQTQIPMGIPKQKLVLKAREIQNSEKEANGNKIQFKGSTNFEGKQTAIGDITKTSINKYLNGRSNESTEKEVKYDTMKFKDPCINKSQATMGVQRKQSYPAKGSFIPSPVNSIAKNKDLNTAMKLQTEPFVSSSAKTITKNKETLKNIDIDKTLPVIEEEENLGIEMMNKNCKYVPKIESSIGSFTEQLQLITKPDNLDELDNIEMMRKLSVISEEEDYLDIKSKNKYLKYVPKHDSSTVLFTENRTNSIKCAPSTI